MRYPRKIRYQRKEYDRYEHIWKKERYECKPVLTIEEIYDYLKSGTTPPPVLIKFLESLKINSPSIMCFITQYMETKYYEFDARTQIQSQFQIEFQKFITTKYYTKEPYDIVVDYIKELDKFCGQGSTEYCYEPVHSVYYAGCPHHWSLKPEFYELHGQIPEHIEEIKAIYRGLIDIYISRIAKHTIWGN